MAFLFIAMAWVADAFASTELPAMQRRGHDLHTPASGTFHDSARLMQEQVYKLSSAQGVEVSSDSIERVRATLSKMGGCEEVRCAAHSSCTNTIAGPQCICNEGYVGIAGGHVCTPPPEFKPHRILYEGTGGLSANVHELHVAAFGTNMIAIVFRDESRLDIGRIVVGTVREAGLTDLSPPEQFTLGSGKAYDPVVAGNTGNLVVAWRDENRDGSGWLRAASIGRPDIRGATTALTWGDPQSVCGSHQTHKMLLVPVGEDRVVLMFSDKSPPSPDAPQKSFGTAILATLGISGQLILSRQRFLDYPLCRLQATRISSNSFVVGARAGKAVVGNETVQQEAVAILGHVSGDRLSFDTSPLNLAPNTTQIWARGLSLIAENTVAYAFQDGLNHSMKIGIIEVQNGRKMRIVRDPHVLRHGFSPYLSMLDMPYTVSDPHTLAYYETSNNSSAVSLCRWTDAIKDLTGCQEFVWHAAKLPSVTGVHLGGGKSFMVFADETGTPYYTVFGLSRS